jgi:hypothetical protein
VPPVKGPRKLRYCYPPNLRASGSLYPKPSPATPNREAHHVHRIHRFPTTARRRHARDYFFTLDLGAASGHQYVKNASGIHSKGN